MNILLQCSEVVEDENISCEVIYILTEMTRSDCIHGKAYGFMIKEYTFEEEKAHSILVEQAAAQSVFEEYEIAERFFGILVRERVLPATLIYHIDDFHSAFHPWNL